MCGEQRSLVLILMLKHVVVKKTTSIYNAMQQ